jgi:hypothetical protein
MITKFAPKNIIQSIIMAPETWIRGADIAVCGVSMATSAHDVIIQRYWAGGFWLLMAVFSAVLWKTNTSVKINRRMQRAMLPLGLALAIKASVRR